MLLREILATLEAIAPLRHAESWDNVGLLAGDPEALIHRALLTIDYTPEVAAEARRLRAELVVAYHPPLFQAVKRLDARSLVFQAIRDGIALYSPHTALDVAEGGTNDLLADALDLATRGPLQRAAPKDTHYKLVTFVPEDEIDRVSAALFAAGAGQIGKYAACSFRAPGTGTFFGEEGSKPVVGSAGKLERVNELRLETVLPIARAEAVIAALRSAHPYEEPAFDLVRLAPAPDGDGDGIGIGRIGELAAPRSRAALIAQIKRALGVDALLVAGPLDGEIRRAAVCAGAGGSLLEAAIAGGAELFLTGELRHHDALRAASVGMTVVCALHSSSERPTLARVKARLEAAHPGLVVALSKDDRDPFSLA
ncbi:MAG: Nif3-like dinuclear metal center hexameric protein [Minicystis sp.]